MKNKNTNQFGTHGTCLLILTKQSSPYSLQHGEDGEEVQSCIDALETIRFAQATCNLLHH